MGNGAQSMLGLLCVAALIALPTLQEANSSPDAPVVAVARANEVPAPQYEPDTLPEEELANDIARGGVARPDAPRVAFTGTSAATTQLPMPTPNTVGDGEWVWPTPSKLITSPFGYRADPFNGGSAFHSGIDLGDRCGTAIGSTRAGKVTFAGPAGGYGLRVVVDHGGGVWSAYSHLQAIAVQVGQQVDQSGLLGLVGTTGRSTGCHLHFEIIINGGFTDPMPYLEGRPVANPSTYGNGDIPSAPISEPSASSGSPSPSSSEDPCGVSEDAQDALDTGGMIPVDGSPSPSASKSPCPTTSSPSPSSPGSSTQTSSSPTPGPSSDSPSQTPGASSSSATSPAPSSETSSGTPSSPVSTPAESTSSSATPSADPSSPLPPADTSDPADSSSTTAADDGQEPPASSEPATTDSQTVESPAGPVEDVAAASTGSQLPTGLESTSDATPAA